MAPASQYVTPQWIVTNNRALERNINIIAELNNELVKIHPRSQQLVTIINDLRNLGNVESNKVRHPVAPAIPELVYLNPDTANPNIKAEPRYRTARQALIDSRPTSPVPRS